MSKRINVYIRDCTYKLLKDYMEANEYDMSRVVDDILSFRLNYLEEEKKKAEKIIAKEKAKQTKEQDEKLYKEDPDKWMDNYYDKGTNN